MSFAELGSCELLLFLFRVTEETKAAYDSSVNNTRLLMLLRC